MSVVFGMRIVIIHSTIPKRLPWLRVLLRNTTHRRALHITCLVTLRRTQSSLVFSSAPEHLGPLHRHMAAAAIDITQANLTITCAVHGQPSPTITTNTGYSVDLVFAAQITGDVQSLSENGILFTGVFIYLPIYLGPAKIGAPAASPPPQGTFMTSYQGSGARMLANLRFNPLLVPNIDMFCASLFPRTASGGVDLLTSGSEMGFILNEVDITPYTSTQLPFLVPFMETYVNKSDPQKKPIYVNGSFPVTLGPA